MAVHCAGHLCCVLFACRRYVHPPVLSRHGWLTGALVKQMLLQTIKDRLSALNIAINSRLVPHSQHTNTTMKRSKDRSPAAGHRIWQHITEKTLAIAHSRLRSKPIEIEAKSSAGIQTGRGQVIASLLPHVLLRCVSLTSKNSSAQVRSTQWG